LVYDLMEVSDEFSALTRNGEEDPESIDTEVTS
jgi:hypothetical protein